MSSAHLEKFDSVRPADIEWSDGLPFSREFNDVYFSVHGALEESTHVFISGNHLLKDWQEKKQDIFTIVELGFGSGLNFLNTAKHWQLREKRHNSGARLHYVSIEKRPFLKKDLEKTFSLWPELADIASLLIQNYPSSTYGKHQLIFESLQITLTLLFMPIEVALEDLIAESDSKFPSLKIDHWYLDGFAPSKNESMWGLSVAKKIANLSKPSTRLATYSVAASVKNPLKEVGFRITKRKGFAKKREMLTATFGSEAYSNSGSKFINIKYEKPWFNIKTPILNRKTNEIQVAIIGGGIAGSSMAYALSQKDITCHLYEKNTDIASEASGAAAGIFHPQLTADMNIGSQFNWLAYLTLLRFISGLSTENIDRIFIQRGLERFLKDDHTANQLLEVTGKLNLQHWIKKSVHFANNQQCIHYPHSGAVDIAALCQLYLDLSSKHCTVSTRETIKDLVSRNGRWIVTTKSGEVSYQHVIYCGGAKDKLIDEFNSLSTNTSRGQTCFIKHPTLSRKIDSAICEQVYLVGTNSEKMHVGTTFDQFEDDTLNQKSQNDILNRTFSFIKRVCLTQKNISEMSHFPLAGTVGYRLHSADRLPIVGAAFDPELLKASFYNFGQTKLKRSSISHYNQKGLWLNTAYGSHGLLYSLLSSQHLASLISSEISPLQKGIADAINPSRFFVKALKHL